MDADAGQNIPEIGLRIKAVEPVALDQGIPSMGKGDIRLSLIRTWLERRAWSTDLDEASSVGASKNWVPPLLGTLKKVMAILGKEKFRRSS